MGEKLVYYIAGPMTGTEDMGRARFNAMEVRLRGMGMSVLNPACLPLDMPPERYMPICLAMLREADVVLLLDGWDESEGARLEHDFAVKCHKRITLEGDVAEKKWQMPVEFKQTDLRWAKNVYSCRGDKHQTMRTSGSGPTVCADIVATLKDGSVTPWTLAQLAMEWGDRTDYTGTAWPFFKHVAEHFKFSKFVQSKSWEDARECLDAGGYVICSIYTAFFMGGSSNHTNYYCVWKYDHDYVYYLSGQPTYRVRWQRQKAIDNAKQYFCFYPDGDYMSEVTADER